MKEVKEEAAASSNGQSSAPIAPTAPMQPKAPPLPLDYVDEIINMLKTAFPLLALMMEKMVDHISIRAKPNSEEDIYRFFAALLNDAMQVNYNDLISHLDARADLVAMVWKTYYPERRRRAECHDQGQSDQICQQSQWRITRESNILCPRVLHAF